LENLESILVALRELPLGEKRVAALFIQETIDKDQASLSSYEEASEEGLLLLQKLADRGHKLKVKEKKPDIYAAEVKTFMRENHNFVPRQDVMHHMAGLHPEVKFATIVKEINKVAKKIGIINITDHKKKPTGQWHFPTGHF
jgi:hypothetical protein